MDLRGVVMIVGAIGLMAAPVAWKYLGTAAVEPVDPVQDVAAAEPTPASADATPAEPVRREMAGGAVFVSARD